jgi:hypothetical protein
VVKEKLRVYRRIISYIQHCISASGREYHDLPTERALNQVRLNLLLLIRREVVVHIRGKYFYLGAFITQWRSCSQLFAGAGVVPAY